MDSASTTYFSINKTKFDEIGEVWMEWDWKRKITFVQLVRNCLEKLGVPEPDIGTKNHQLFDENRKVERKFDEFWKVWK